MQNLQNLVQKEKEMTSKPDITVRGIRFNWDFDSQSYSAQVEPEDVEFLYEQGYNEGYSDGQRDMGEDS